MASFDWMKAPSFKEKIRNEVLRVATRYGMKDYQEEIIDILISHLEEHRDALIEKEEKKPLFLQRTESDALKSVEKLIRAASEKAKAKKQMILESADFESSYNENFCAVWPFCNRD